MGLVIIVLWVLGVAAMIGIFVFVATHVRPLDTNTLPAIAAQQGWSYQESAPEFVLPWSGPPFGSEAEVNQVFSGLIGSLPFTAFQYLRVERTNEGPTTIPFAMVTIPLPAALPSLSVSPQTFFQDSINDAINPTESHDITFESIDFNKAFVVAADTDEFGYAVIHPPMMEYLLASPFPSWSVQIAFNNAVFWAVGPQLPDQVVPIVTWSAGFVQRIPSYVYDKYATAE
jgi:hypothetical protein